MNVSTELKLEEQIQELLELLEQIQTEVDQKNTIIEELQKQLKESLELSEKLNNENKAENVQTLKNDLRQANELLREEKIIASNTIEVLQGKLEKALEDKTYAEWHQRIEVEKPALYEKCQSCDQISYRRAKERYDQKYKKSEKKFKVQTAFFDIFFLGFVVYSLVVTIFMAIRSQILVTDFKKFIATIWSEICIAVSWVKYTGKSIAQLSDRFLDDMVATVINRIIYFVVIAGISGAIITVLWFGIRKISKMYRFYCWDKISVIVAVGSLAVVIFFGDLIKQMISINLLDMLLLVQIVYVIVRWYVKNCRISRGYY